MADVPLKAVSIMLLGILGRGGKASMKWGSGNLCSSSGLSAFVGDLLLFLYKYFH